MRQDGDQQSGITLAIDLIDIAAAFDELLDCGKVLSIYRLEQRRSCNFAGLFIAKAEHAN